MTDARSKRPVPGAVGGYSGGAYTGGPGPNSYSPAGGYQNAGPQGAGFGDQSPTQRMGADAAARYGNPPAGYASGGQPGYSSGGQPSQPGQPGYPTGGHPGGNVPPADRYGFSAAVGQQGAFSTSAPTYGAPPSQRPAPSRPAGGAPAAGPPSGHGAAAAAPLTTVDRTQDMALQQLTQEVKELKVALARQSRKHDAMDHSQGVTSQQYVSSLLEGDPVDPKDFIPIHVGTISVVELMPRQARVPKTTTQHVGTPITKKVPLKSGLSGRLFGPKVTRVTGYTNVRHVEAAQPQERQMVLYQPVIGPGRKRAVCIGINYVDSPRAGDRLEHCCNDARYMRQWLHKQGFADVLTLVDDDPAAIYPSRENILKALKWLVHSVRMGDNLFLVYSGHGDWKLDFSGDEDDDHDECLVPADYYRFEHPADPKHGYIIDDELYQTVVKVLPKGAMLHAMFDACHSGTILDLPYVSDYRGRMFRQGFATGAHSDLEHLKSDVIMLSAAKDHQQTPDRSRFGTVRMGLLTYAFLVVMEKARHPSNLTYHQLMAEVQNQLIRAYPPALLAERAIPIMSSSKPYNLDHPIVM
eukprot:TRINITY_DN3322_c0_g1_i1.p1 TRINITY_DN3322_c0_g1~~TRINITY_DN3322_c0_g1_i1.p1  ORF type:complete len:596 (-),score=114.37 TRINITY_DN3322_c0_g1_i1:54-1796(-)